jgi:hypothetical protein
MAKKTPEMINPICRLTHQINRYGLRGSAERIIEMIDDTDSDLYSFAITEDNKAMVVVIARNEYFDEV